MVLSVPACLLAAYAPSDSVLFVARILGGVSAGMAYPTTLALITALWSGPAGRSRSRCGRRSAGRSPRSGPLVAGCAARAVLVGLGLPRHAAARRGRAGAWPGVLVPAHVNETTEPVDNLGGILSVVLVGALILAINFAPVPDKGDARARPGRRSRSPRWSAFVLRQRRAAQPAVRPARRRPPDLLGRRLRRDHRVRLADGRGVRRASSSCRTCSATPRSRPARRSCRPSCSWSWCARARRSWSRRTGARFTLLLGYVFLLLALRSRCCCSGRRTAPTGRSASRYAFIGIGVGLRRHARPRTR